MIRVEVDDVPERVSLCEVCDWIEAGTDDDVARKVEEHRLERHAGVKPGRLTRDIYLVERRAA